MKPSLLRYFAWISLTALLLSCVSPKIILKGEQEAHSWASNDKAIFKATIIYHEEEISGRVLIKKFGEDDYRIAFYNEMGMTYLEGTLKGHKLELQNIMPVLDNRVFLRKFEKALLAIL